MPKPRPEASGLAELVVKAEKVHRVSPLLMPGKAAEAIGVSTMTLKRWRRAGRLYPAGQITRGAQAPIPLYGPAQIEAGKVLRRTNKPGPTPLNTDLKRPTPAPKVWTFNADSSPSNRAAAQ